MGCFLLLGQLLSHEGSVIGCYHQLVPSPAEVQMNRFICERRGLPLLVARV